jgi:hypothetical protein
MISPSRRTHESSSTIRTSKSGYAVVDVQRWSSGRIHTLTNALQITSA